MKICSFSTHGSILPSVVTTVNEIAKHVDRVFVLIDQEQEVKWFANNVELLMFENKWLDFWKHLQFFHYIEEKSIQVDELLLSNDTIDALSSFDSLFNFWRQSKADFRWSTDWYTEREWQEDVNWRHIQSFFIAFRWKALIDVIDYYKRNWYLPKRPWVKTYEMWISRMLILKWYKGEAFIKVDNIMKKYWLFRYDHRIFNKTGDVKAKPNGEMNWSFQYPQLYIEEWLPFVKNTCMKYDFNPPIIQYLANRLYSLTK